MTQKITYGKINVLDIDRGSQFNIPSQDLSDISHPQQSSIHHGNQLKFAVSEYAEAVVTSAVLDMQMYLTHIYLPIQLVHAFYTAQVHLW